MTDKTLTYGDLPDCFGMGGRAPFLLCLNCQAEYSAHRGDYWDARQDKPVMCACGEPLRLMVKRVVCSPFVAA